MSAPPASTPASAPVVMANSKENHAGKGPDSAPWQVSNSQPTASKGINGDNYSYPVSIKPERLLKYMKQQEKCPTLLLIDVRMQKSYDHARIKTPCIINIEPIGLRSG